MPAATPVVSYPKSLSVEQAADALGVAPVTIRRLIQSKKLKASKVGRRVIVRPADIDKYLDANPAA